MKQLLSLFALVTLVAPFQMQADSTRVYASEISNDLTLTLILNDESVITSVIPGKGMVVVDLPEGTSIRKFIIFEKNKINPVNRTQVLSATNADDLPWLHMNFIGFTHSWSPLRNLNLLTLGEAAKLISFKDAVIRAGHNAVDTIRDAAERAGTAVQDAASRAGKAIRNSVSGVMSRSEA